MTSKKTQTDRDLVELATELVKRAKAGERGAFDRLVRLYRQRVFALALHITGNRSDADDVTQDAFLRAYKALDRFEGRSQFFTWLYRVTVNRALNARRGRKRRREVGMDDPRLELALVADACGNPVRAAMLRQTYSQLLSALDQLPMAMRTTVVLVTLQGFSHAEAAAVQGCPPGTIAWRLHEARRRLRTYLTQPASQENPGLISTELAELLGHWGWPVLSPN